MAKLDVGEASSFKSVALQEVLTVAAEAGWQVLSPWETRRPLAAWGSDAEEQVVLLPCHPQWLDATKEVLLNFQIQTTGKLPRIIAVVLRQESGRLHPAKDYLLMRTELQNIAPLELVAQPLDVLDLGIELESCLDAMRAAEELTAKAVKEISSSQQQDIRALEEAVTAEEERVNIMFFSAIHRMLQDFPKMQYSIEDRVADKIDCPGYTNVHIISAGRESSLFRATTTISEKPLILEVFEKSKWACVQDLQKAWTLVRSLRCLNHPNVIEFLGAHHWRYEVILTTEDIGTRCLDDLLKTGSSISLEESRRYSAQLSKAVSYCHSKGIGHRNICWSSIYLTSSKIIKLSGLEDSVILAKPCKGHKGKNPFIAPEAVLSAKFQAGPADIWSLGVVMLELVFGLGAMSKAIGLPEDVSAAKFATEETQLLEASELGLEPLLKDKFPDASSRIPVELVSLFNRMLTLPASSRWNSLQVSNSAWLIQAS